jgi:phosphodiesterase/alkaline phosphatase D-like protein
VTPTTATVSSMINPRSAPTVFHFQYGTTSAYGLETSAGASIGSDETEHLAEETLTGLQPATTYHFRAVAVNFNGVASGLDQTFTTPSAPSIVGSSADSVTATTALIGASIHPGFRPTTFHVEFGRSASYGASTLESASIGSDNALHAVSATIVGLAEGTTYHYRVVASNAIGMTQGADGSFTTATIPPLTPTPTVRCPAGFVKRKGKCVKRHPHKQGHHKRRHKKRARR